MKRTPKFKNEDEEREFWADHSPLDYFDHKTARRVSMPNLKPSLRSISIRLPEGMIGALKVMANNYDVPYQSLIKMLLAKALDNERHGKGTVKA